LSLDKSKENDTKNPTSEWLHLNRPQVAAFESPGDRVGFSSPYSLACLFGKGTQTWIEFSCVRGLFHDFVIQYQSVLISAY
jgi:hypothetical protein